MAYYDGEQHGLPTVTGVEPNWHGRWEFWLDKVNPTTYNWTFKAYISLSPGKKAKCDIQSPNPGCPQLNIYVTSSSSGQSWGPYGPVIGGNGWYQFRDTITGSFTVSGSQTIYPAFDLFTGVGSSMGTGLMAIDTWHVDLPPMAVVGITAPSATNIRCTGKTSSSLSMAFDIDWGGDENTRTATSFLFNSSKVMLTQGPDNSYTFTGLTRYTPYYIRGKALNSVDTAYTDYLLVYTDPENPTISAPTISNSKVSSGIQGVASVDVTPGVVTDNGGKAITQVETYIRGGQYGSTLTSIGTGTSKKTVNNLLPNTEYYVITRATNGITESYSGYKSFITLGNPPEFTDIYASNLALTSSSINYSAKYEYNARYKEYQVEWRYPGTNTWTKLAKSTNRITGTNFDDKNDNRLEYRVTVTDNWERSTTSNILSYRVLFNYINDITNIKAVRNSDDTFTISGNWTKRLYTKIQSAYILGSELQNVYEIPGNISNMTTSQTGFNFKTKPYKNKRIKKTFTIYLKISTYNNDIPISSIEIPAESYPNAINTVNKSGSVVSRQFSSIGYNTEGKLEVKRLRQQDIIKLSKRMRYIDIDSRGTLDSHLMTKSGELVNGRITVQYSYDLIHVSKILYNFKLTNLKIKTNNNSTIRIRNNNLILVVNDGKSTNYKCQFTIPNMIINSTYQSIDTSSFASFLLQPDTISTIVTGNLTLKWNSEFDYQNNISNTINLSSTLNFGNSDIANNHLVNLKIYDNSGNDIALGKSIRLTDGSNPIIYNGGNPTNNITNSNKYIYSENGLPLRIDLGSEYEISKILIQRRILDSSNFYSRNYIIGRNSNKEICYIFYDSSINGQYHETNKIINVK